MKRTYFIPLFFILLFTASQVKAEAYFKYTVKAKDAYNLVVNLQLEEAKIAIQEIKYSEPDNMIVYHIENYIDFFTIFITEDKALFQQLEKNKRYRLRKIASGDKKSPYYLFAQAEINLQWALLRIKFGDYLSAFNEVSDAYQLLEKNQKRFPNFVPNKKSLGILHSIVGTVPNTYRWGVKLIGKIDGSIAQGRREIEDVLAYANHSDFIYEAETEILYAFLLLHLANKEQEAWQVISNSQINPKTNPLGCFVQANIALHAGKTEEAIKILDNRPTGQHFLELPYLEFMEGLTKLYKLDPTAEQEFLNFLAQHPGENYIKEAYQKLAWNALIHNQEEKYHHYMALCKEHGAKTLEGDEAAFKEANEGIMPDVRLLKIRMLFDGGYYQRAMVLLKNYDLEAFQSKNLQLEFAYRSARVFQKLERNSEAIFHYLEVMNLGKDSKAYYACNSALQIGIIYEQMGHQEKAKEYFQKTLKIKPNTFKTALHGKAKAGLNRLKG